MDFDINTFIANFHFVRPLWLLAFVVLIFILFIIKRSQQLTSPWQSFLPPHLSTVLLESANQNQHTSPLRISSPIIKAFIIGFCTIIALAGPAWQKLPQPVFQLERGSVLIMDMSYSMYSTDIKPNRLTRARYKAVDLLENINEGEIGLIAYAGDAFVISPLTQDIKNIELLLPSLSPDIMPSLGSNPFAALTLAHETLNNAGHLQGDIYWFTDDVDNQDLTDIYDWATRYGHTLNILGIGTASGAPIKLPSGELLKDNNGAIVVPRLPEGKLASLANKGQGAYQTISHGDDDITLLTQQLNSPSLSNKKQSTEKEQQLQGDQYQEQGPWFLLILIPLILSYFRRGSSIINMIAAMPMLLMGLLATSTLMFSQPSYANEKASPSIGTSTTNEPNKSSATDHQFWQDLWKTKDQQGQTSYNQGNFDKAAAQFSDSQWQASAHYKAGNYEQALKGFKQSDTSEALYNQGNTHAQMQNFDEAISAYNAALKKNPNFTDAQHNLEKVKQIKEQKEQQKQSSGKGDKQQSNDQQNNNDQNGTESQENNQQGDNQQQNNDSQQSGSGEQDGEQDSEHNKSSKEDSSESSSEQSHDKNNEESDEQSQNHNTAGQPDKDAQEEAKDGDTQQSEATQAEKSNEDVADSEKSPAQIASDNATKETQQKHQQILNKVTDDPYLLLRNKMKLEYQKRKHEGSHQGVTKKW